MYVNEKKHILNKCTLHFDEFVINMESWNYE